MATIDAAIIADQAPVNIDGSNELAPALDAQQALHPTPEPEPTSQKPDPKQAEIDKAQANLLGEEEARRIKAEEEAEANKADMSIGNVPTPGSIAFPLILLLLLFFILIQIGGYSRLGWLWLVLTGNAAVGSTKNTAPDTNPTQEPVNVSSIAVAPSSLSPLVAHSIWTGSGMTGVPF